MWKINLCDQKKAVRVGDCDYGTPLSGIKGHPDVVYVKVKQRSGTGVNVSSGSGMSVLMNLKCGTLRQVEWTTECIPLAGNVDFYKNDTNDYLKDDRSC